MSESRRKKQVEGCLLSDGFADQLIRGVVDTTLIVSVDEEKHKFVCLPRSGFVHDKHFRALKDGPSHTQ